MSELVVSELSPGFGAEIKGLEPRIPLDEATIRELREVFDERSVLVFRDLDIDEDFQRHLLFALIDQEPPVVERATPFLVSNKEENGGAPYGRLLFHCDTMWADVPQPALSLYGLEVGQPSVPTMFASMVEAWKTLPPRLRERVQGLQAKQGHENRYANRGGDDDVIDSAFESPQWTVTPVANRNSRTGQETLYVSQQVTLEILDLDPEENEELLEELFDHLYQESNIIRHDWRTGDLVIWDNEAVQHARGNVNLDGPERTLRKVTGPLDISALSKTRPTYSKVDG
ncbi:MAG TPA: TauD/TfdA family dioxygenase [Acidimicrobiales bacterium]